MEEANEISVIAIIKFFKPHRVTILVFFFIGLLFGAGAYFFKQSKTPVPVSLPVTMYQAEQVIVVGKMGDSPLESPSDIVGKISYGYCGPLVHAETPISTYLVKLTSQAASKTEASDALNGCTDKIIADDNAILANYQASLKLQMGNAQIAINRFIALNQDAIGLQGMILDLQSQLAKSKPSVLMQDSTFSAITKAAEVKSDGPSLFLLLIIGGILGLASGVAWVSAKAWWDANKTYLQ